MVGREDVTLEKRQLRPGVLFISETEDNYRAISAKTLRLRRYMRQETLVDTHATFRASVGLESENTTIGKISNDEVSIKDDLYVDEPWS